MPSLVNFETVFYDVWYWDDMFTLDQDYPTDIIIIYSIDLIPRITDYPTDQFVHITWYPSNRVTRVR